MSKKVSKLLVPPEGNPLDLAFGVGAALLNPCLQPYHTARIQCPNPSYFFKRQVVLTTLQ